ncbi:MAG: DHA2 family efflux MFS transporter permease subunit [Alphaproteobacteria bacterium]|nr:DHA2 family efflux MFS transporter permease subunit [Alphaproteobacteria bacterium]MBV9420044.1 DHA2 family efflux MFS transporter permease subunit [Alphaproteobacteria bacterium]MBV9904334.1 DHA2 family efflux MFS transporter permease subunit [Alphaproteobacteria bacterium]
MCLGMSMAVLDIQIVASSFTTIQAYFQVTPERLSWIQTAYLMAEVIAIPLTGWLTRAMSLRWMFAAATFGFTLASLACAACTALPPLIALRVVQGFCGGMLIPGVFTSVFVMMPEKQRIPATALAGTLAVIAPTVGPAIGGYLTEHYTWHWIFLINLVPGLIVSALVALYVRLGEPDPREWRRIDYTAIALAAVFLGTLEVILKEAPKYAWQGVFVVAAIAVCAATGFGAIWRSLRKPYPFVDLYRFRERTFTLGCLLSFVLGLGLYGSVYLLSIFLGLIREHSPWEIGTIMIVSGAAQLLTAPIAAWLEARLDARLLTAFGYSLFAAGLITNGFADITTDYDGLFWPQLLRGAAVMLCILPATRLALDTLNPTGVADGSALFNLMRNLGGAIGIALVDTILEQRTPGHATVLANRLQHGDPEAARLAGLPVEYFHGQDMGPVNETMRAYAEPLIKKAALVQSFNEAWLVIGALFALSLLVVPFMRVRGTPSPEA